MAHNVRASDAYLSVGDTAAVDITDNLTVFGWFYRAADHSATFTTVPFSKWLSTGNQRSWLMLTYEDGTDGDYYRWLVSGDGSSGAEVSDKGVRDWTGEKKWLFLAGTYSPSTSIGLYIGEDYPGTVSLQNENTTSIPASLHNSSEEVGIGQTGTNFAFNSGIANMGIINATATLAQLNELSFGRHPAELFGSSVVAYYRFFGGEDPVLDLSGNGLTASYDNDTFNFEERTPAMCIPGNILATSRPTAAINGGGDEFDPVNEMFDQIRNDPDRTPPGAVPYRFGA